MLTALGLVGVGLGLTLAAIIAQASETNPDSLAPYVSGGGAAAAVGGLIYMARKILSGDLISRPTQVVERELVRLVNDSHSRETTLQEVMLEGLEERRRNRELTERLIEISARLHNAR